MGDTQMLNYLVKQLIEGERIFGGSFEKAFYDLEQKKYTTFTMPSLVDALINAPENTAIWQNNIFDSEPILTSSIKGTGWAEGHKLEFLYAHTDHYLSNADHLRYLTIRNRADEESGGAELPHRRFTRLIDMDAAKDELGNRVVWVLDYNTEIEKHPTGSITLDKAVTHPRLIASVGGEKRLEKYLERYSKSFGNIIFVPPTPHEFPQYDVAYFMGIGANGSIIDYLSPTNYSLAKFIGFEGKSRPNSWEIIGLADKSLPSANSAHISNFGVELGKLYVKMSKHGYGNVDRPTEPSMLFYKEARPSFCQVKDLANRLLPDIRAEKELFISKLPELYK